MKYFDELGLKIQLEWRQGEGKNLQLGRGREKETMIFILNICTNHGFKAGSGWEPTAVSGRADRGDDYYLNIFIK